MSRYSDCFSTLPDKFCLFKIIYFQPLVLILGALGIGFFWETAVHATPLIASSENASKDESLVSQDADSMEQSIALETTVAELSNPNFEADTIVPDNAIAESSVSFAALDEEIVEPVADSGEAIENQPVTTAPVAQDVLQENQSLKSSQPIAISTFLQQHSNQKAATLLLPTEPSHPRSSSHSQEFELQLAAAAPENFNPGLSKPRSPASLNPASPAFPPLPPPLPETPEQPIFDLEPAPFISFSNLQVDFRRSQDNFGQLNQFIEPTLQFRFGEEPALFKLKTGLNTFKQRDIETITNIPLQLGWENQIGNKKVEIAAGIDVFNRLPTALNFNSQVTIPVTSKITFFGVLEHGPYKANAETLQNQITAWRFGPNMYWQLDRNTSFFSSLRIGLYNDGNREQQSFSRLERRFGQFYAAANVFNWIFRKDVQEESGYFSPPDFLVYNGEIGWEGNPLEFLRCRVNTNLGQQRLNGRTTRGNTYQARCTVKLARRVELDVGYEFTNVANRNTGDSVYANQAFLGQLRVNF